MIRVYQKKKKKKEGGGPDAVSHGSDVYFEYPE